METKFIKYQDLDGEDKTFMDTVVEELNESAVFFNWWEDNMTNYRCVETDENGFYFIVPGKEELVPAEVKEAMNKVNEDIKNEQYKDSLMNKMGV